MCLSSQLCKRKRVDGVAQVGERLYPGGKQMGGQVLPVLVTPS
jgi:hypothetical protein